MLVLSFFTLVAAIGFVAFTVDVGIISHTKTRMQNAVDAAALAAVLEISNAIKNAGPDVENVPAYAQGQAAAVAEQVMAMNGIYIDPSSDVEFGTGTYNEGTGKYEVSWGTSNANVVRVHARKDNADANAPDAKLNLFFAGFFGEDTVTLTTSAVAYIASRDIVSVLDFSRSMNFDSYYNNEANSNLSDAEIYDNLQMVWDDLQPLNLGNMVFEPAYLSMTQSEDEASVTVDFAYDDAIVTSTDEITSLKLRFKDGVEQTFTPGTTEGTFSGSGSNIGKDITRVYVTIEIEPEPGDAITVSGQPAGGAVPHIEVTFAGDGTSISVVSTKDLSNVVLVFEDGVEYKFDGLSGKTGTFAGVGSNVGKIITHAYIKSGSNASGEGPGYGERFDSPIDLTSTVVEFEFRDTDYNVRTAFALDSTPYPYPAGSWNEFISYVRTNTGLRDAGMREMYGGASFLSYILSQRSGHWETPDLWKTRHYPFHSVKEGQLLFVDFLEDLGFGDRIGTVSYDTYHRVETSLNEEGFPFVDIGSEPITDDFDSARNLVQYKQAAHYAYATNMGGGLSDAITLLDTYKREGARPTILLMTDGNTNTIDSGANTSLPSGWDWNALFDYNGDGASDYYTDSTQKRYVLRLAKDAIDRGYTIHTMAIGQDADWQLMQAIAHMGDGEFLRVDGGTSVEEMHDEVQAAYYKIASEVPPAQLLSN